MSKNLLIVLSFLLFNIGYGQKTWTGATNSSWDVSTNWSPVGKPIITDNVIITNATNQPVITSAGASCAKLELRNSTPGSNVVLTVKGLGTFALGSIVMNSTNGDTSNCTLNISGTTTVTVTGDVTMNGNALQDAVTFSGDGNLFIGGVMTGGTLNADEKGTVTYNGNVTRNVGEYSYNNLTISGGGIRTITPGVIVNGLLTMAETATVSAAPTYGADAGLKYTAQTFTVGPEWVSPFIANGGIQIAGTPGVPSSITMGTSVADKKINDGVKLIIEQGCSLRLGTTKLYLGGDFINNNGLLITDGLVYLTGDVDQSIDGFTSSAGVSMIKNTGTATFTGNVNGGELIINGSGVLNLGEGLTHSFTNWVRTKGTLNAASSVLKFSGNVTGIGGAFTPGTGTVEFSGGAQNLGTGSITYNNLVLSGSGTKTFGAATTINDTFSIVDGVKADLTANLVHTAKSIKLGTATGSGGSWGSSLSNAVNKNNTFFVSNNGIVNVGPTIVINTTSLTALTTTYGTPSSSKSFDISGLAMLEGILVIAPSGFEVSTDGTTFSDALTIGAAGAIASKTVFVRLKGTIDAKDYSGNIVLTSNGTTTINVAIATSTVNKAPLTINAKSDTRSYGSDNPTLAATYVGFVNGDTATSLTTQATIATTAVKGSAVGDYPITVSGASSSNYTITYGTSGKLTVTPVALTITAIDNSKVYGSDNPALTASYVGFVNGDTAASLTTQATIATTAVKGSAVGDYPISVSGAVSSNYTIAYGSNGKLTVTPAALTITATDNSKVYGSDNPALTANYVGFVNGDTAANLTTQATIATTAVKGSAVGNYPISVSGAVSSNYTITYGPNAVLKITPAALTITVDSKTRSFGLDNPTLTASYAGFVNGDTVANLTAQPTIATTAVKNSPIGDYTITANGATSLNYSITYVPAILKVIASSNAGMTDLAISEGTLSPAFTEGNKDYTAIVPNDTKTIKVTPTTADTSATVTVNGKEVPSGTASGEIPLEVGENTITTVVTAQDGTINTYTIVVTREPSSNADLTDLAISEGTLSPAFEEGTKDYTTTVPNDITSVKVTPTTADTTATVTVNGKEVASGTASGEIPLKVGENEIKTVIKAEDGTTKTYTVIVTREPSSNADLSNIIISDGTLDPVFDKDKTDYKVEVPNETNSFVINPIPADPNAKVVVIVDGKTIDPTVPMDLKVGDNDIKIVVTAEDGTTKEYEVIITRDPSGNSGLNDLAISEGTLSPAFAEGTKDYTATVPNDIAGIKVTPTTADTTATVTVNGKEVPSGTASGEIPLEVGENTITTVITAQDGTTTTYTVIVTREEAAKPSDNAGLSDIVINNGELSPTFNTDTNDYRVEVPNETDSFVIKPLPIDPNATVVVIVDGKTIDPTAPIDLKVGENVITIVVTAEDGTTTDTYTVIVDRAKAEIVPTNIITPNGDGKNDFWVIPGIESYSNNSVKVFDRAARLVYSKNNYNNDWDGSYKGSPLTEETYYYLIDLGNGTPKLKGFITIIRN